MIARALFIVGCAGLFAAPAAASGDSGKTTICHRTGAPARASGLFPGHIIEVSTSAKTMHLEQHKDVPIAKDLLPRFGGSRICQVNAAGALFDAQGKPIQSSTWDNSGADPGDPG